MGNRTVIQADEAELSTQIFLWRKCKRNQNTGMGYIDSQPTTDDNETRSN